MSGESNGSDLMCIAGVIGVKPADVLLTRNMLTSDRGENGSVSDVDVEEDGNIRERPGGIVSDIFR